MIRFEVPGTPVAKGRHRTTKSGHTYTPERTRRFEEKVAFFAMQAMEGAEPIIGPVELRILAVWPMTGQPRKREPRPRRWKPTKPDGSNVAKAIEDACNGICYADDGQVVRLIIEKWHAAQGEDARTVVEIEEMP